MISKHYGMLNLMGQLVTMYIGNKHLEIEVLKEHGHWRTAGSNSYVFFHFSELGQTF